MQAAPQAIRLAGQVLGDHRHVCALFEGPDEADVVLLPFIAQGLMAGERGIQIVDSAVRAEHLDRLGQEGIDVAGLIASGQLAAPTWDESYLQGGRFDVTEMTEYVLKTLALGRELGYPLSRLIGYMGWALTDRPGVSGLIAYEARVDELLERFQDVVVCVYDLTRHSARTIAEVLSLHSIALVGGVLRPIKTLQRKVSARERILLAASRLFHETGIRATGVDSLIKAAGVAKATFYRHFPTKDDLVVAWLRDPRTRWLDHLRRRAESSDQEPLETLLRFFDAVAEWLEEDGFRGCPYLNTAAEIADPTHPAMRVIQEYLAEVEDYIRALVAAVGYREAELLAAQLQALLAGGIMLAMARRSGAHMPQVRRAVEQLLGAAERP